MATTIITKYGSGAPTASDVVRGELAVDTENGRLYTETSGGAVIEIGLNPSGNVDVTGTVTADGLTVDGATVLDIGDEGTLQVGPTTTAADENQTIEMRGSNGSNELQRFQIANRGEDGRVDFKYGRAGATPTKAISIGSGTGDISFYEDTGTTPKLVWKAADERLGIGTSSPSDALHVLDSSGNAYASIARGTQSQGEVGLRLRGGTSGNDWYVYQKTSSDNLNFYNTADRVTIDSSGNVGIGAAPVNPFRLEVTGASSNCFSYFTDSTLTYKAIYGVDGGAGVAGAVFGSFSNHDAIIRTNNTERMRIDSNGNVGIGFSAAPNAALQVGKGALSIPAAGASTGAVCFGNDSSANAYGLVMGADSAGKGYISAQRTDGTATTYDLVVQPNGGNLLVGCTGLSTDAPNSDGFIFQTIGNLKIRVATDNQACQQYYSPTGGTSAPVGSITCGASSVAYNTSSDQRLKDNIVDAPSASDDIDAIQVRSFDWKADGSHQKYGMVAQELQTVAPEAVSQPEDPEEMMGVDYSKLVPMMLKEIQQLRARVAELESK